MRRISRSKILVCGACLVGFAHCAQFAHAEDRFLSVIPEFYDPTPGVTSYGQGWGYMSSRGTGRTGGQMAVGRDFRSYAIFNLADLGLLPGESIASASLFVPNSDLRMSPGPGSGFSYFANLWSVDTLSPLALAVADGSYAQYTDLGGGTLFGATTFDGVTTPAPNDYFFNDAGLNALRGKTSGSDNLFAFGIQGSSTLSGSSAMLFSGSAPLQLRVSVTPHAAGSNTVPEPGTIALVLVGLAAGAIPLRNGRRRTIGG